jgi:integrase
MTVCRQGKRPARCTSEPWAEAELERLHAAARTVPGLVGDVRADRWWPALLLATVDTSEAPRNLLWAPFHAYDRGRGLLRVDCYVYALHNLTIAALEQLVFADSEIVAAPDRLFRWHRDYSLLFPALKTILARAGLPAVTGNLFERLRVTGVLSPGILDRINPHAAAPRPSLRPLGSAPKSRDARPPRNRDKIGAVPLHRRNPEIVLIESNSPRTVRNFFATVYAPRRFADCKPDASESHMRAINWLCAFAACEVTVDQLSDDFLEDYVVWKRKGGAPPATINGHLAAVLALWRYAWRKKWLDYLPRDVEKLRVPKRLPDAWSPDQVGLILDACAMLEGELIGEVPAPEFMRGLILTLYDTGLRIGALLQAEGGLAPGGWLTIAADSQKHLAEQAFRLHADTVRILEAYPAGRRLLFETHWQRPYVELAKRFKSIVKAAGVPLGPKGRNGFHKLRRTNATCVADVSGDEAAQRQLGHSSLSLTRRGYIDPRQLTRRAEPAQTIRRPAWTADLERQLATLGDGTDGSTDRENRRL